MLDKDLRPEHVQSISNADEVAGFFSYLGYNTTERIKQSPSNLGITNETLLKEIKKIELIANQENLLQVYLIEISSVTIATTQTLVRVFRNRVGNYLLVLTSDYDRIDFVLIERLLPSEKDEGIGTKQASIRPRILTVDRLKPTRIDQRVLRRFSYTEADPIAQYEKLQAAYIVADWSEEFFNNRALFSDYYLLERLRDEPEWKENIKPVYIRFREIYQDAKSLWSGKSEQEFRKGFLNQVFETLGYSFKESKRADDDSKEPDYIFYDNPSSILPLDKGRQGGVKPLCFCLTYPWGRSLDGKDYTRDINTPDENPGAVVVSLLDRGDTDWVIVTNGKLWRLYSSKAHSRATNYYEIDLEEVLARLDPEESFRYFYLFFRKEAFIPGSNEEQKNITFLDRLLKGSEEYAKRLGERLKKRVFEEIFPHFAKGFISYIQDVKGIPSLFQSELDKIFQGTLTFLYRLLFLLYSESRNLLPVKEMRGYHGISLSAIKKEIADKLGDSAYDLSVIPAKAGIQKKSWIPDQARNDISKLFSDSSTDFYDRLQTLFKAIDTGDITLNVPAYNGGLFMTTVNPEDDSQEAVNARLLIENKVPDKFFVIGLDLLTRDEDEKTFKRVFIDYKSLGVRHLGSIYEGLLEFHLRIAPEKMAICEGKKTEKIIPYSEAIKQKKKILKAGRGKDAEERILPKGTVYLENTKHERKATGSYYTPDYIVKYIVENTVGPVLKEKFEALTPKFREAQWAYREAVSRSKAFEKKGMKGDDPEKTAFTFKWLVDELFDVKVLDPAMGSGHFLVEAVDFITDKMIDFLNGFPWNPVMATLRETRDTILKEMEKQNITIDETRLNDLNLLKRHVLKRCIYGVDLNPMAVELAKVSLWLDCFTLGAPLSFLDHHLKCGNSLIGATVAEVKEAVEPVSNQISKSKVAASAKEWKEVETINHQAALFGSRFAGLILATDLMRHVGELSDVTATQVRESRAEYKKASDTLAPFKRIFDIYVSQWFGNDGDNKSKKKKTAISPSIDFLRSKEAETFISTKEINKVLDKLSKGDRKIAENALNTAREKRFFHWELEFPEVFYGKGREKENPGFDAVIGNPPYISNWSLTDIDKTLPGILEQRFKMVATGHWDIYILFVYLAVTLLRRGGYNSFITPSSLATEKYGAKLRDYILDKTILHSLIIFGETSVFDEVARQYLVFVTSKEQSLNAITEIWNFNGSGFLLSSRLPQISFKEFQNSSFRVDISATDISMKRKIDELSIPLGSLCCVNVGVVAHSRVGASRHFLKDNVIVKKAGKGRKRYITGDNVARYNIIWTGEYLDYEANRADFHRPKFPELFESEKVIVRRISGKNNNIISSIDKGEYYTNDNLMHVAIWTPKLKELQSPGSFDPASDCSKYNISFIGALLNSKFLTKYFSDFIATNTLQGSYTGIYPEDLRVLPVRKINFTTPHEQRKALCEQHRQLYINVFSNKALYSFLESVSDNLEKTDIIHDLIAFLAEQMVEINEKQNMETERFLSWFEKAVKIQSDNKGNEGIDVLTGKDALKKYAYGLQNDEERLSFNSLIDILHRNRAKIGISMADSKLISTLKTEYEKSLSVLLPLKEKLKKTDWLIDQIVYKLYGLTEEEIKIVEERD